MAYQFQLYEKAMKEWITAIVSWQKENPGKDWFSELKKGEGKKLPPLPKKRGDKKLLPLPPKPPKI